MTNGGGIGRHTPLLGIVLVLVLALTVLPSALNTPQTNPSTTLEYAPVPPADDDANPPPGGNLSSLGLAGSGTLGAALEGAVLPAAASAAAGAGKNPSTKRCVGNPPRQTEDPLSPPCVAHFQGDNFGATYQGVTRDDVIVMFTSQVTTDTYGGNPTEQGPAPGSYTDLGAPPTGPEFSYMRTLRAYQSYFNARFQTYGRKVRFVYHVATGNSSAQRRADAADEYKRRRPFAAFAFFGTVSNYEPYIEVMTQNKVVTFLYGGTWGHWEPSAYFAARQGLLWSYSPYIESRAEVFASYVCRKVLPYRVSFAGDPALLGRERVLGFLRTTDPGYPYLHTYATEIKKRIEACGGRFAVEAVNPVAFQQTPQNGGTNASRFAQAGVTTVIWADGAQPGETRAMATINYHPEIVIAGTEWTENALGGVQYDASVWRNARVVTTYTRITDFVDNPPPCYAAAREGDPGLNETAARNDGCALFYSTIRQIFTGIQVAGPRLTPATIDKGFHAIPQRVASPDPTVPACFYEPGDYTCVKDAMVEWYDPAGATPGSQTPSCWRMMEGGKRYLAGTWPAGDVEAQRSSSDVCNFQAPTV